MNRYGTCPCPLANCVGDNNGQDVYNVLVFRPAAGSTSPPSAHGQEQGLLLEMNIA